MHCRMLFVQAKEQKPWIKKLIFQKLLKARCFYGCDNFFVETLQIDRLRSWG